MSYRDIEGASSCKHLHVGRSGMYLDSPVRLRFVCTNPEVSGEYPHATFDSLDICRICEHWAADDLIGQPGTVRIAEVDNEALLASVRDMDTEVV